jgi:nucleoside-diphosphate-sugar epimerase
MTRVALFGASGLVGATCLELMRERGGYDVRPIIHTTGNAWRLARLGVPLTQASVTDLAQVKAAVKGCELVINCALGSNQELIQGIEHLITACREERVKRLVHLSSVLIYGERPAPEAAKEEAAPRCDKGSYAWFKLRQDEILEEACRKGFEAVTLCIPNVTGTYSRYLVDLVACMRRGEFALVGDGGAPIVAGDVRNIAHALLLAGRCREATGERIFINDGPGPTWGELAERLRPLAEVEGPWPSVSAEQAQRRVSGDGGSPIKSALKTARQIAGLEAVKNLVKENPDLSREFRSWRARLENLPPAVGSQVQRVIGGGAARSGGGAGPDPASRFEARFLDHQLRGVAHSIDKARRVLDYQPPHSFAQSVAAFSAWYRTMVGHGGEAWPLLRELHRLP